LKIKTYLKLLRCMFKINIKNNKVFPSLECDCCCEEAKIIPCHIKQCDYNMCKKCIKKYKGELCPKCRNPIKKKENKSYVKCAFDKFSKVLKFVKKKWLLIFIIVINGFLGLILGNVVLLSINCNFYHKNCKTSVFNHQFLSYGILGFLLFSICLIPIIFCFLLLLDMMNYCFTFGHSSYITLGVWIELKKIIRR